MPKANTNENRTMVLNVTPKEFKIKKLMNMESGMATPTNKAFRSPRKNNSTPTTNSTPKMMEF